MHPDDFEQKLERQTLRQAPSAWREEILVAANVNRREKFNRELIPHGEAATLKLRLRQLFWPAPQAWACLAAVWLVIFALNFSLHDKLEIVAKKSSPPSPEMILALREQGKLFAEMVGPDEMRDATPPKPQPHSERRPQFLTA